MPSVCVCDCGFDVVEGELCPDWTVFGMKRVCATSAAYSNSLSLAPRGWQVMTDQWVAWTNTTCRTHRVVARIDVPWLRIKIGPGNNWVVRGYLDGTINGDPVLDVTRAPELQWSANWHPAMPPGTDQEQQTPGAAEVEWLVPPGDKLTVGGRLLVSTPNWADGPVNMLAHGPYRVSLSAWPAEVDAGGGRTC